MDARHYSIDAALPDGEPVHIRAIRPDDKAGLVALFERLSPQTIYYRFLGAKKRLSREELVYLTELDFHSQAALVAVLEREGAKRIVGVVRYASAIDGPEDRAEVAVTVEDAEQHRGIGTLLLEHLALVAYSEGILAFEANLLADNQATIALFEDSGRVLHRTADSGICHLVISTRAAGATPPPP
jgi:GNAT superfamily N-acetyltransferase